MEHFNITLDDSNLLLESNMRNCFQDLNYVNEVYREFFRQRDVAYDASNEEHEVGCWGHQNIPDAAQNEGNRQSLKHCGTS